MRSEAKQIRRLRSLIRREVLPGFDEVDWSDVFYYWTQRNGKTRKKYTRRVPTKEEYYHSRARSINTRALEKGQTHEVTGDNLIKIMEMAQNRCKNCGGLENLVFDHIIPYYRGGTNEASNLQVLCRRCNMEKGVG